jgi:hypothetical protein
VSKAEPESRKVVFVCRVPAGENLRSAQAIKKLDGVVLLGIAERGPSGAGAEAFTEVICVEDVHDARQLIGAARSLEDKHGSLNQIVTAEETLLKPVAEAGAALGLPGMSPATVRRALDKSCLKSILRQAGINTARDEVLSNADDAKRFVGEVGFPIVLKPLGGSGGLATWLIRSDEQLEIALELMCPSPENAVLAEIYLRGQELCIDTITIAGEPQFHSICCYRPSILEALENPEIQWTCVMPRDISDDRYHDFIEQGLAAVRALSVGNAMTHMEGFLHAGGLSFTDATLRPAGARIAPMLAFAYDIDPYLAWARVALDGCFDGPWERKYSVGTIFLRGSGAGQVERVDGLEQVKAMAGELLVDVRLPRIGAAKSATYTGDGYITVRHPETQAVEHALDLIAETVHITYTEAETPILLDANRKEQLGRRLQYFSRQLNKPAWDNDYGVR